MVSVLRLPPAGRLREDSQTPALEKALRGWAGALETVFPSFLRSCAQTRGVRQGQKKKRMVFVDQGTAPGNSALHPSAQRAPGISSPPPSSALWQQREWSFCRGLRLRCGGKQTSALDWPCE